MYQQFLKHQGWHYGAGVVVTAEAGLEGSLTFNRPKEAGKMTIEEGALLQTLQPHITAVIQVRAAHR